MLIRKNSFVRLASLVVCGAIMTGCGKGAPSALTSEQEQTFKETMASAQNAYRFARAGRESPRLRSLFSSSEEELSSNSASHSFSSPDRFPRRGNESSMGDGNSGEMNDRLADAFKNGKCSQSMPSAESPRFSSEKVIKFEIKGDRCPILASFSIQAESKDFSLDVTYKFQDLDFLKYNDVDHFSLHTSGNFDVGNDSLNVKLKIGGGFHSQKIGEVSYSGYFNGSGTRESEQAEGVVDFTFPTFQAQIKMVKAGQSEKYFLNGKEATQEEVQTYFKTFVGK